MAEGEVPPAQQRGPAGVASSARATSSSRDRPFRRRRPKSPRSAPAVPAPCGRCPGRSARRRHWSWRHNTSSSPHCSSPQCSSSAFHQIIGVVVHQEQLHLGAPARRDRCQAGIGSPDISAAARRAPTTHSLSRRNEASCKIVAALLALAQDGALPPQVQVGLRQLEPVGALHQGPKPLGGDAHRLGGEQGSTWTPGRPDPPGPGAGEAGRSRNGRASTITIMVALGTSTPTSITVVATSTSIDPWPEQVHHRLLSRPG